MGPSGPRRATSVRRRPLRAWWAALVLPAAVLAVHQLRYLLAYGSHAAAQLSARGDHYVSTATLIAGTLVAIALAFGVLRLMATWRGRSQVELVRAPLWLLWLGLTLVLLAGFCAVEGLEMVFEPHHPAGLAAIWGSGGWWAVPAAAFIAALMALLVHGGRVLLVVAARRRLLRRAARSTVRQGAFHRDFRPHRPMATCAAGRAPPFTEPV
jgi:hypothetical protein